jgi:5,10-methylene-tetrahydrofolate dehydrogenase/methenyl tetrahydrofolate cyclohydrolase
MVSQLCFSPDVLVAWLRRVRAAGITLPLHLGLAAPTPMRSARDAEPSRTGQVIDGRTIARGITAGIATLLIGGDYPARAYEQRIGKMAAELGVAWYQRRLPEEEDIFTALEPAKDIEAVHPENAGLLALGRPPYVPSTPAAVFHVLDRWLDAAGEDRAEFHHRSLITVVGRSGNIGQPAVSLAYDRQAAVDSVDEWASRTGQLGLYTRRADVLIVAAGVPGLIRAEHVRQGAIVLDVEHAAWAAVRALLDPTAEGGQLWGPWFLRSKGAPALEQPTPAMTDRETAGRLWTLPEEATGVAWPLQTNLRKRGQSGTGER